MDSYEATRVVYSRIQSLDPENASKIMGLLLIQDHGEKEMIRLAFGPENLVHSVILKARNDLRLNSNNNSPSSSSSFCSSNPIAINNINNNSNNSIISRQNSSSSPEDNNTINSSSSSSSSNSLSSSSLPFNFQTNTTEEFQQLQEYDMSFMSHRRSCSVSDVCLAAEDQSSGFGWKPCLYYAKGFCKNGTTCRFLHGDDTLVNAVDHNHYHHCHHQELLRSKSVHSHDNSHFIPNSFPYSPKCINFLLNDSQRVAATGLMMGSEDLNSFGRTRLERNEFLMNGCVNPASRQIYLTFPADSTFREEDVSNYFSIYGPVQDVRIPYQQKRMFGFVTFVYSETVKLILAKGNPHFVCDARVLVKPYKEKGKVQDKYRKQQQQGQVERGDFSPCGTPTGLEPRDPFDLQLGARMYYNSQDMLWRRKLEEQAEFQQALELQSRRLMNLQLLDVKKVHHRALSTGSPIQSPSNSPNFFSRNPLGLSSENPLDHNCSSPIPISVTTLDPPLAVASGRESPASLDENVNEKVGSLDEIGDLLESLDEHNLPDSPFASPTKSNEADYNHMNGLSNNHVVLSNDAKSDFSSSSSSSSSANSLFSRPNMSLSTISTTLIPSSSPTLDMASFKSYNCQLPRFSTGHGAIGMYAGTAGGPKFPVGI